MTWQIFVRAAAESDLESLSATDQQTVASEMFAWVEQGPPRQTPRAVLGVPMFDDTVASGFRVTYVVDDEQSRLSSSVSGRHCAETEGAANHR